MKRLLLHILLFNSFILFAQNETFKQVKIGNDKANTESWVVKQTYDSAYMIVTFEYNKAYNMMEVLTSIYKYDINGNLLWKKYTDKGTIIYNFLPLEDGSVIFIGGISTIYAPEVTIWTAFKLDACGNFLWGRKIESSKLYEIFCPDLIFNINDGVMITARRVTDNEGIVIDMVKMSYNGDLIWRQLLQLIKPHSNSLNLRYGIMNSNYEIFFNGSAFVPHPFYPVDSQNMTWGIYIVKIDSNGELLWENYSGDNIPVYGKTFNSSNLIDKENNIYTLISQGWIEGPGYHDAISYTPLLKFDTNGNLLGYPEIKEEKSDPHYWRYNFEMAWINDTSNIVTSMIYYDRSHLNDQTLQPKLDLQTHENNNKNYYHSTFLPTEYKNTSKDEDKKGIRTIDLRVIDKDANLLLKRELDTMKGEVRRILSLHDGNILVLTTVDNITNPLVASFMMKYTPDLKDAPIDKHVYNYDYLCDHKIESGYFKTEFTEFELDGITVDTIGQKPLKIYPNPAEGSVKLYLGSGLGIKTVHIIDMAGKICKTIEIAEGFAQTTVDISDLVGGVYFVKIYYNGFYTATEKLIVK